MWTYTSYIIAKLCEKQGNSCDSMTFSSLADFIFNKLYFEKRLIFYDGKKDLFSDIEYLKELQILDFVKNDDIDKIEFSIKDIDKLNRVAKIVKHSGGITKVNLLNEYVKKIDAAIIM